MSHPSSQVISDVAYESKGTYRTVELLRVIYIKNFSIGWAADSSRLELLLATEEGGCQLNRLYMAKKQQSIVHLQRLSVQ